MLDFTFYDETLLTNEEFPEKTSKARISKLFGMCIICGDLLVFV